MLQRHRTVVAAVAASLLAMGSAVAISAGALAAPASPVVISEVYGGGGNSGATYKQDFIELHNTSTEAVNLDGWSVQYTAARGTTWQLTKLTGSIAPGGHYLIGQAKGETGSKDLPKPDAQGDLAMRGSAGKVALVTNAVALTCASDCNSAAGVADFLGWGDVNDYEGSAPAPTTPDGAAVFRSAGVDTGDNSKDFTVGTPTPVNAAGDTPGPDPDPGGEPKEVAIADVQGTGDSSPLDGKTVTVKGVVTAAYPTGGLSGFYLQTPGTGGDIHIGEHTASFAVFAYSGSAGVDVAVGDYVQVTGVVGEYADTTQINYQTGKVTKLTEAAKAVKPVALRAFPDKSKWESLEGMLVDPSALPFTVTQNYDTNRYGEIGLAIGEKPLVQPTEAGRAGSREAAAQAKFNEENSFILDDGSSANFLKDTSLAPSYISLDKPLRAGAPLTFTAPVIFTEGGSPSAPSYRFQPTAPITADNHPFTVTNTRTDAPDAAALAKYGAPSLKVASFNVLNYFTLLGKDGDGCTSYNDRAGNPITVNKCTGNRAPRGAWDEANLNRQQDKIVAAINATGADVVGLMEIENSARLGRDNDSAVKHLVEVLNTASAPGTWAFVPSSTELPTASEMDTITNAIIYKPGALTPVGPSRALSRTSETGKPFANAREPIGQIFAPAAGGEKFLFVVNHFKSKGSPGPLPGDADSGDGQGASNASRMAQAKALAGWVPTVLDADTTAVVLAGDFNSYSPEDPMAVLYGAGYTNANTHFNTRKYSYFFNGQAGSLDHVLLNDDALKMATGADIWNINAPESIALQYSRYNNHGALYYEPNAYASSDHDPVIVGLAPTGSSVKKLNLLNINDFHGRIGKITVPFALTIETARAAAGENNTVLLSAGDDVGASLFESALTDDKPTIDVLNALELRSGAVGNHEFDKGFDDLTKRIMAPQDPVTNPHGGAKWKHLGANVYQKGTTKPALPEYDVITIDGVRLGIIGAVTQETPTLVTPGGISTIDFGDPVDAVNRVAAQLTDGDLANGEADVLVAEYHDGASAGTPEGATPEQEVAAGGVFAKMVNETSPKVAAIFTGHTHKEYAWMVPVPGQAGKQRPIVQTGSYGENVGQIELSYDSTTKQVVNTTARNIKVDAKATIDDAVLAKFPRVAEVKRIVDKAVADAAKIGSQPIAKVTADITTAYFGPEAGYTGPSDTYVAPTRDDRSKESALGNLVANSLVSSLSNADRGGAQIGIVNPGGLRAELPFGSDGTITYAQANGVLPFVNNLWTVTLTGAQFKTLLEQQWQTLEDGSVPSRPYLQLGLSDNVSYTYDPAAAQGSHVTSVTVDGKPLDPAATYRIGTFSFLAAGGDNFRVFKDGTDVRDSGLIDRDAWIDYLKAHSPLTPRFARHAVSLPHLPNKVNAGDDMAFTVGGLNLTSLGAPRNTTVKVELTAVDGAGPAVRSRSALAQLVTGLGEFPVTTTLDAEDALRGGTRNGIAEVALKLPETLPGGNYLLSIVAEPSGTRVVVPLEIAPAPMPPGTEPTTPGTTTAPSPTTPGMTTAPTPVQPGITPTEPVVGGKLPSTGLSADVVWVGVIGLVLLVVGGGVFLIARRRGRGSDHS